MGHFIYAIQNRVNGKVYIGQTVDPPTRFRHHFGVSAQPLMKRAIAKYGRDAFECTVLEVWATQKETDEAEAWWICYLQTIGDGGYNLSKGGRGGVAGIKRSEETRRRLSEAMRGKPKSALTCKKLSLAKKGKPLPKKMHDAAILAKALKCVVTDPSGTESIVVNLKEYCRNNGLTYSAMQAVLIGRNRHHKGWKVRKYGEPAPIFQSKNNGIRRRVEWDVLYTNGKNERIVSMRRLALQLGIKGFRQRDDGTYFSYRQGIQEIRRVAA